VNVTEVASTTRDNEVVVTGQGAQLLSKEDRKSVKWRRGMDLLCRVVLIHNSSLSISTPCAMVMVYVSCGNGCIM
jgi:hypothetical protein